MSFSTQISSDLIIVEAGDNSPVGVTVVNRGEEADRYEVQVEGLDPEWTAIPVPIFSIAAGETQTEKVFFKPGRASESLAGNYPFVVKVRSLNSGESRQVQGVVQIKPYNHLSMDITPKKGSISPAHGLEIFHALIMNLGNTEQTLQLYGSDPEDAFAFEFDSEQVTIGPGQQKEIEVRATPTNKRPFSSPRLHVFTISARSIQTPSLVTSSQAQLEQRPVVTPVAMILFIIIAGLILAWWRSRPQPPSLTLTLDSASASYKDGDKVTVTWHAVNANAVQLSLGDQHLTEPPDGSASFTATASGTVEAIAVEDKVQSKPVSVSYVVKEPTVPPDPEIDQFEITQREVPAGQPIIIKYKVRNAVKVVLEPNTIGLDATLDSYPLKGELPGYHTYHLVAENVDSKSVTSREIKVHISEESDASIVAFDVQPRELDPGGGEVTVTWQVTNASRIEISTGDKSSVVQDATGQSPVQIDRDTEFYLTAYDSKGVVTKSQRILVRVKPPEQPTPTPTTTTGAPDTTTTGAPTPDTTGNNNPPPPTTTTGGG
jgi:hypothetical protein